MSISAFTLVALYMRIGLTEAVKCSLQLDQYRDGQINGSEIDDSDPLFQQRVIEEVIEGTSINTSCSATEVCFSQ